MFSITLLTVNYHYLLIIKSLLDAVVQNSQRLCRREAATADPGGVGRDTPSLSGHLSQVRRRWPGSQLPNEVRT